MATQAIRATASFHSTPRAVLTPRPARAAATLLRRGRRSVPRDPDATSVSLSRVGDRLRPRGGWRVLVRWIVGLVACWVLWRWVGRLTRKEPLRIPERPFTVQPYRHFSFTSPPPIIGPSTRVLHVTKEFGPATMGGLGVMLTSLAVSQSSSSFLDVAVILPHYSFLNADYAGKIKRLTELSVPVLDAWGRPMSVGCVVSVLRWEYDDETDFLSPLPPPAPASPDFSDGDSATRPTNRTIEIYLVGPGDRSPFHVAFKAKDAGDVYSAYRPLKQEWKDLWFAKASAELIAWLGYHEGTETLFVVDDGDDDDDATSNSAAPSKGKEGTHRTAADVVHLHGATNALVAFFLREMAAYDTFGEAHSPALVYTLHDTLDEVEYSNLVAHLPHFLPSRSAADTRAVLSPYIVGKQLFTSALGIDLAQMVTFVSRSIAQDLVEGRFGFALQSLILPSLSARASTRSFVGISNGLDFSDERTNPFISRALLERHLAFPRVGKNLTDLKTFWSSSAAGAGMTAVSFSHTKERAKDFLIESLPTLFGPDDAARPWLLFVGRFQYNKGCQFFAPLLELLSSSPTLSARLIVMGAHNNFPRASLLSLAKKYPNHLTLIDDAGIQREWGTLVRMASDFAFVPSFSEAFGLVAAEGLLFGMGVISTGVGGLAEFLVPVDERPSSRTGEPGAGKGNAYLFSLSTTSSSGPEDYGVSAQETRMSMEDLGMAVMMMGQAVREAVGGWRRRQEGGWMEREAWVRGLVGGAVRMRWGRDGGPITEYVRVYDLALIAKRTDEARTLHGIVSPSDDPEDDFDFFSESLDLDLDFAMLLDEPGVDLPPVHQNPKVREKEVVGGSLPIYKVWDAKMGPATGKVVRRRRKKGKKAEGKGVKKGGEGKKMTARKKSV